MVFQVRTINNISSLGTGFGVATDDKDVELLRKEFKDVFRDDLPEGLPPRRDVDHKIETDPSATPPYRGIFQLSPAELLATKEYVT